MAPDESTDIKLSKVFPDLAVRWRRVRVDFLSRHGRQLKVAEGIRDFPTQLALFAQGRKKLENGKWAIVDHRKIVTHALPGESFHAYGLAIDTCFLGPDCYPKDEFLWDEYGRICKSYGLEWGGDWSGTKNDRPHCQLRYGLTIHDYQSIYEFGGIKGVWTKCNQIIQCGGKVT